MGSDGEVAERTKITDTLEGMHTEQHNQNTLQKIIKIKKN